MEQISRRHLLSGATVTVGAGITGCLGGGATPRYQLSASTVPGTLFERFRWKPRGEFPEADRLLMDQLVREGSLTTAGYLILDLERPQYVERNGTHYEVSAQRSGTVEREHWVLWFDLIEGSPPSDAAVFTSSLGTGEGTDLEAEYGLSALDRRAVEDSTGEVVRESDLNDLEDTPLGRRGHIFLRRDESDTELLPDPPFTHVRFELNDGTRYARAVTERGPVELQQYEYEATAIATSAEEYKQYVREKHLRTRFDRSALPAEQRDILDRITKGGGRYEEVKPLSEAMQTLLERLGLAEVPTPDPKGVAFSEPAYFRYRSGFFRAELQVFR